MLTIAIFAVLLVFIMIDLPIVIAIALTAVVFFVGLGQSDFLVMLPQRMYSGTTSFVLLAVPFFILAGNLMNTGGITSRIFRFAKALIGHVPGGLGHVSVARLFMAGFIPGVLMGLAMMFAIAIMAKPRGLPRSQRASLREVLVSFREAILPLLAPVSIIGGFFQVFLRRPRHPSWPASTPSFWVFCPRT